MARSEKAFKELYNCLLESEELYTIYGGMTGEWEKDKENFKKNQLDLEQFANYTEINDED